MRLASRSHVTAALGTCALITAGAVVAPQSASAEEVWTLRYDVKATTYVAKMKQSSSTTGSATSRLTPSTGALESDMTLKEFRTPVKIGPFQVGIAVIRQEPVGPAVGKVDFTSKTIKQTSKVNLHIVSISPFGHGFINYVGNSCKTATPVTINASGALKGLFDPTQLKGTYTIPPFANCGLLTSLVTKQVSGPGNTVDLTLTPR